MSRVVVTGGAGFIGSHLVRRLLSRGDRVSVIDNLSTGSIRNIPAGTHLIIESVLNEHALSRVFRGAEHVFHLAAIASVPRSMEEPELTHQVNVEGTRIVLEAADEAGIGKVVFASSSSVYGNSPSIIQGEDTPTSPLSPYAQSKLDAEVLCEQYRYRSRVNTVCLRYFNVYGPGQRANSGHALVVPAFIKSAVEGRPLVIYGSGRQKRDFIYIDDIVDATMYAAESNMAGIYNVGSGRSTSVLTLARTILRITRSQSPLLFEEARQGDPDYTCADMSKIGLAGFAPAYTLSKGLRRTIRNGYSSL